MNNEIVRQIQTYYRDSEAAYLHWGLDLEREGIYALHCGFSVKGEERTHYEEVKELTRQLIKFAQIPSRAIVLDAGCGCGAVSFELSLLYPDAFVFGVNISPNQIANAEKYRRRNGINKVIFALSDYNALPFCNEIADRVVFCESLTHSADALKTLNESYRILKFGGRVVIGDTFLKRAPVDLKEKRQLLDLTSGWYLPSIVSLSEFSDLLKKAGFVDVICLDKTDNIIGSSRRMRANTEKRIMEENLGTEVIRLSRKAVIACNQIFESGLAGYYFLTAGKLLEDEKLLQKVRLAGGAR